MMGKKQYFEQREIFKTKDQALDFIEKQKALLISLRQKNNIWCLKYLIEK